MPTEQLNAPDRLIAAHALLQEKHPIFKGLSFENEEHNEMIPGLLEFLETPEAALLEPHLSNIEYLLQNDPTRTVQEAADIRRAVVTNIMYHQLNLQDDPDSHFRQDPAEGRDGLKAPYSVHTCRVVEMCLDPSQNKSTDMTIAGALHDTIEDCTIRVAGKELKGKDLLKQIETEFSNYKNVPALLDMVSYSGRLNDFQLDVVRNSDLYKLSEAKYEDFLLRENKKGFVLSEEGKQEIDRKGVKTVYGLAHIFQVAREYAGEDDALYYELLFKGLGLKAFDSYDNMGSKSLHPPISLRNRIIGIAARVMGWDFDNELFKRLISQDERDPFNPADTLSHIMNELEDPDTLNTADSMAGFLTHNKIPARVTPRPQVSIADERVKIPAIQYLIETLGDNKMAKKLVENNLAGLFPKYNENNTQHLKPIAGALHKIMKMFGRRTQQFRLIETTKSKSGKNLNVLRAYLRFDDTREPEKHPKPYEFTKQGCTAVTDFPESRIFYLPPGSGLGEAIQAVTALFTPSKEDFKRMKATNPQLPSFLPH